MALRVAFFGTPAFAVPCLEAVAGSDHRLVGVVTQPDRPRGRGQRVVATPVKAVAERLGVPVLQPERLKDDGFLTAFEVWKPDIGVVAAYGKLLPLRLIESPRLGMINVHASLLPRWRGAAPIHRAIVAGDRETGVTIMRVVLALDAGPMLSRGVTPIGPNERSTALEGRLAILGADLAVDALRRLDQGPISEEPQDESLATYATRLTKADSRVDWNQPARDVHNQIRGLHPWPLAAVSFGGQRLRLLESELLPALDGTPSHQNGTIVLSDRRGLAVGCADGPLLVTAVQPDGRPAMSARDFANGHRVELGMRFDPLIEP